MSWPFAVWGLDIVGKLPRAIGGYEYLFVAIDKFTKWTEVEPVRSITTHVAIKFIKGLVCRFGVPNRIITENSTQFTSNAFLDYCEEIGTKVCFASVTHPRSNGQVERANAEVLRGLESTTFENLKLEARTGLSTFQGSYGRSGPRQVELLEKHLSSSFTGLRQYSLQS